MKSQVSRVFIRLLKDVKLNMRVFARFRDLVNILLGMTHIVFSTVDFFPAFYVELLISIQPTRKKTGQKKFEN